MEITKAETQSCSSDTSGTVQSVDRTFAIIEALSARPRGMNLTEICDAVSLHKSTVHRLLNTLIRLNYVNKMDNLQYSLSLKFCHISGQIINSLDPITVSKPHISRLCETVGETVHLVMRQNNNIVYLWKEESLNLTIKMVSHVGMQRSMVCTAVGKIILSTLPDEEIAEIWQQSTIIKHTPYTIDHFGAFMDEIRITRSRGYALDNQENELGVRCIAAAIYDHTGESCYAISVSAPIIHFPDERIPLLVPELLSTAKSISSAFGYHPS